MMTGDEYLKSVERLGMTQVGSAKFFGVDDKTAYNWATGKHPVPDAVSMLLCLMEICELTPDDVLELADQWVAPA